jgi:hypothetical protein
MDICCQSIYLPDKKPGNIEPSNIVPEETESEDLDFEDKQIYEGNFENIPTITQSEIRIFLSSTFKG